MSINYCHVHDRFWDQDFLDMCPRCENEEDEMEQITYTLRSAKALKEAYKDAVKYQKDSFVFEGREYVRDYAKYLLQFLETKFGKF